MNDYQKKKIKGSAMIEYALLAASATVIFSTLTPIKDGINAKLDIVANSMYTWSQSVGLDLPAP